MMSDHNSSDLAPQRQEMSVENVASGLVPQGQKASDYDNSDPLPHDKKLVPSAERQIVKQEMETMVRGRGVDEGDDGVGGATTVAAGVTR
ncbi:hypothetical protein Tco_0754859 [Tanacetum coccineum]